ncbi:hypothetical protein RRG08_046596 [Elysia crispata]|uniref:Uncharacterized protein n=1 Tax=Elysia crispata TaxID=231223 RepID=A0AAE1E203_9GAST|nr:hypothetical protein RRG08_046596 [Elysia crispata]
MMRATWNLYKRIDGRYQSMGNAGHDYTIHVCDTELTSRQSNQIPPNADPDCCHLLHKAQRKLIRSLRLQTHQLYHRLTRLLLGCEHTSYTTLQRYQHRATRLRIARPAPILSAGTESGYMARRKPWSGVFPSLTDSHASSNLTLA